MSTLLKTRHLSHAESVESYEETKEQLHHPRMKLIHTGNSSNISSPHVIQTTRLSVQSINQPQTSNQTITQSNGLLSNRNSSRSIQSPPLNQSFLLECPYNIRVAAVIEASLSRLMLVAAILNDPSLTSNNQSNKQSISVNQTVNQSINQSSPDLYSLFTRHGILQQQYESLHAYRATLQGLSNKSKLQSTNSALTELSHYLTESDQSIKQRINSLKPDSTTELRKKKKDLEFLLDLLNQLSTGLQHRNGDYRTFLSLVQAESNRHSNEENKKNTSLKLQQKINEIQQEIKEEEAEFQTAFDELNTETMKLGEDVNRYKNVMTNSMKYEQQNTGAKFETINSMRMTQLTLLKQQIHEINQKMKQNAKIHKFNMNYLNYEKNEVEAELAEWQAKAQQHTTSADHKYATLLAEREKNKQILIALQERWRIESERKKQELHERVEMAALKERMVKQAQERELAARKIQFAFRVYWRKRKVELKKLHKAFLKKQKAAAK